VDRVYAPWRDKYVTRDRNCECVFCDIVQNPDNDQDNQVLYRDDKCFIVMNRYPYSPAHMMIIPHHHTSNLEELDSDTWTHMNILAQKCVRLLKEVMYAQGVNLGMNLGEMAGAGIAEHIHLHILPRWKGDTNFITTVAGARVYSSDFFEIYNTLKDNIDKYID
jgi:diadenosine tetraphosphate (Ap4A) HIT family hydrolase